MKQKRFLLLAALLACLSPLTIQTAQATSATIDLAPGIILHLGDRDDRGRYWDGGRWRDDYWWRNHYRYGNGRWWRHEQWRRHQEMRRHHWEKEHRWHDRGHHHH